MYVRTPVHIDLEAICHGMTFQQLKSLSELIARRMDKMSSNPISKEEIITLFKEKGRTHAVKAYRESCDTSILSAIDYVDQIIVDNANTYSTCPPTTT